MKIGQQATHIRVQLPAAAAFKPHSSNKQQKDKTAVHETLAASLALRSCNA
jgi:hypothetical protein